MNILKSVLSFVTLTLVRVFNKSTAGGGELTKVIHRPAKAAEGNRCAAVGEVSKRAPFYEFGVVKIW